MCAQGLLETQALLRSPNPPGGEPGGSPRQPRTACRTQVLGELPCGRGRRGVMVWGLGAGRSGDQVAAAAGLLAPTLQMRERLSEVE